MYRFEIKIPEPVVNATGMTAKQTSETIRHVIAMHLYTHFGTSIGYCSEIAGMPEEDFIKYLGENHVSIFHFDNPSDFDQERDNA